MNESIYHPSGHAGTNEQMDLAAKLASEGDRLLILYEESGQAEDLEAAIANTQQAINLTPCTEHKLLSSMLCNLGDMLLCRYELTCSTSDLELAIENTQKAIDICPLGHADTAAMFNSLGTMLFARYERIGDVKDLDNAIANSQKAMTLVSSKDLDMAKILNNLGNQLLYKYKRTGEIEFLNEAIANQKIAASAAFQTSYFVVISSNLTSMLLNRYKRVGDMEDLEIAKASIEDVIIKTPEDDPSFPGRLSHLGNVLFSRYQRTRNILDLDSSIDTLQRAACLSDTGYSDLAAILNSLGSAALTRYQQTNNLKDLEDATEATQRAIDIMPAHHPKIPGMLNNVSNKLSEHYERTGDLERLEESISNVQKAIEMSPNDHPALSIRLYSFGNKLIRRYERTGRITDLDEAINNLYKSIELTHHSDSELFMRYNSLAGMLFRRYERKNNTTDLNESVRIMRQALSAIPKEHQHQSVLLNNMGTMLSASYERTKLLDYLLEAINFAEQALDITPQTHVQLGERLSNLSCRVFRLFERTNNADDLTKAITHAKTAVDFTPEDHWKLTTRLHHLSIMQFAKHKHNGDPEGLETAIDIAQKVVDITVHTDMHKSARLDALGRMFSWRYKTSKVHENDAEEAVKLFELAFKCNNSFPLERIIGARNGIEQLVALKDYERASVLANEAVLLLPQVCDRYMNYEDQQHMISQVAGFAADACSLYLKCGKGADRALEILEYGRGLIIGYLIDGHGDSVELDEKFPELNPLKHKAFMRISEDESQELRLILLRERDEAAKALNTCIERIRQLPGQDRFFLPPSVEVLKGSALEGPIILINLTNIGSDAILVSSSKIKAIELPKLGELDTSQHYLSDRMNGFRDGKLLAAPKREIQFLPFLSLLWTSCVRPVLEELGLLTPAGGELPRVWWIGTGKACSLPFHAAGIYTAGSEENSYNYVVSSYTPTMKALHHARKRTCSSIDKHSVLVVTMPNTPTERDLPGVMNEKEAICEVVQHPNHVTHLNLPRKDDVLSILPDYSIVHFACHGLSDSIDPSKSFLALQGHSDVEIDKLTLQEITNLNLGRAWLAYLSACSTAENQVTKLSDEVLHLASSFQVAGFGHVIASMWPCEDVICAEVARTFYRNLVMHDKQRWSNKTVALALYAAITDIRTQHPTNPYLWAQYIHSGA